MLDSFLKLKAPDPSAYLDPLYSLENCFYYSVPRFLDIHHPSNRWLVGRIKVDDADAIRRKLELNPDCLRGKYYQVLDDPALYFQEKKAGLPMYHHKCVLYLTPLGVSLYMKAVRWRIGLVLHCLYYDGKKEVTELLLTHEDIYGARAAEANEIQFASHMQNPGEGDFHAFPPFLVAVRREFFAAVLTLQAAGWKPNVELALPMRRRYERRALYFRDWLDVALHILSTKTFYPLHLLVGSVVCSPKYVSSRLPMKLFRPGPREPPPTPIGIIDVDSLPLGLRMIGVPNLLELAEQYHRYLQLKRAAMAVRQLKRQAQADGVSEELLMQAAQDWLPPLLVASADERNRNNNAKSRKAKAQKGRFELGKNEPYCSEPLRILMFSLERDPRRRSLPQCIQALNVYIRQKLFVDENQLPFDHPRSRDHRNITNCLLNMARREQDDIDAIVAHIRSGRRRYKHVEEHKMLEGRRAQYVTTIERLAGCLTRTLLQSKRLVAFWRTKPNKLIYSSSSVDVQLSPGVSFIMQGVRFTMVRVFNATHSAWRYLSVDMLRQVAKDESLTLHLRVGQRPSSNAMLDNEALLKKLSRKMRWKNRSKS